MYISINWIKEFVDLEGVDIFELINKFTLKTAEVEGIEEKGKGTDKVVIGEILSVKNHPDSDHLHILKVDAGEILDIVCGAPNVRVGMKTAVATVGGHIGGEKITKAKLRGVESYGMCCSGKELGISDDHEGILDLVTDLKNGTSIEELFPIKDIVFEIDNKSLTNRPDLWCHYGIARELASHANRPLKPLNLDNLNAYNDLEKVEIKVDCDNLLRYTAIKVENVTKKLTPYYMQTRLYYCGMRSLNLLADLTNYIMLEVGQPMHAFDGEKVDRIEVEYAKENQEFVTLDGQTRTLKDNDIMIKSKGENVCIGGVMGGLDSEIVDTTTKLLLESAVFDCSSIRKTANRLNLRSEASNRYEKSLDPENAPVATARFLNLLKEIDKDVVVTSSFSDNYQKKYDRITLNVSIDYVNSYIGEKLSVDYCKNVLESIGFKVTLKDEKNMEILVPTFRATKDVSIPADIVEEIARLYGYDNIKAKPLVFAIEASELDEKIKNEYKVKDIMSLNGFTEIYTYIWKNKKENDRLKIEEPKGVSVVNSVLFNEIRNTLTPTMLQCIDENAKTYQDIKVFEIARVCDGIVDGLSNERKKFAYAISSTTRDMREIYFEAKKVIETLAREFGIELGYKPRTANKNYLHPANNAEIMIGDKVIGFMGLVHPVTLDVIDPKINIAVVEVDINMFLDSAKSLSKYYPNSVYQPVNLDFNFVVNKDMYYGDIEKILKSYKTDLHYYIKLVDIYKDEKVLGDNYSYTFNVTLISNTHTLTGEEISKFHSEFINYCQEHNLKLRG